MLEKTPISQTEGQRQTSVNLPFLKPYNSKSDVYPHKNLMSFLLINPPPIYGIPRDRFFAVNWKKHMQKKKSVLLCV